MPPNCVAGISQSLNCAPSTLSRRLRTISAWLNFSCSGNPVVSIASNRTKSFFVCARSSSINFCENSSNWSFHRLSPRNDAKSGLLRSVYSHLFASKSFNAFRRAAKSACAEVRVEVRAAAPTCAPAFLAPPQIKTISMPLKIEVRISSPLLFLPQLRSILRQLAISSLKIPITRSRIFLCNAQSFHRTLTRFNN